MKWFLIFLCFPAFAQLPVLPQGPLLSSSGVPGPSSISGIRYWWVASDLTTNTAVTNWIDRIVGSIYTNGSASLQPTNATTGVGFNGSTLLTNTVPYAFCSGTTRDGPWSMFLIVRPHAAAVSLGAILGDSATARGMYVNGFPRFAVFGGLGNINPLTATIQNDKVIDVSATGPDNVSSDTFYTNAVSITTANAFDSGRYGSVMGRDSGSDFYIGSVLEVIFYTNVISAANMLVLHQYATNTYHNLTWQ